MTDDKEDTKKSKAEKALELALEIRKFEIELYWKRATYFWTFLAVALAGYVTVSTSKDIPANEKPDALLLVSCLGVVFSIAWYFVNRGSKFWQENWEKHVDLLENEINGPLYKTVLSEADLAFWKLWGPYDFSVSKINQLLSLFVVLLFVLLTGMLLYSNYRIGWPPDGFPTSTVALTIGTVVIFWCRGRTNRNRIPMTGAQYNKEFGLSSAEHSAQKDSKKLAKIRAERRISELD
ncbi:MAG TPA: hypothetical protein VIJ01_04010 [Candidatus Angelobacter sp.]